MTVRSKRVAGPVALGGAWQTIYTVPAGKTFRGIVVFVNDGAAAQDELLRLSNVSGSALLHRTTVLAKNSTSLGGVVLNPGDVLQALHSTGDPMYVTVWGSELDGAAP